MIDAMPLEFLVGKVQFTLHTENFVGKVATHSDRDGVMEAVKLDLLKRPLVIVSVYVVATTKDLHRE